MKSQNRARDRGRASPFEGRSSGILLHITSLPGPHLNGDLGDGALDFVRFLEKSGQRWWQMLPIHPIGSGDSPYMTTSTFAGEPLLIAPGPLVEAGLLRRSEVAAPARAASGRVDYRAARRFRAGLLRRSYERFIGAGHRGLKTALRGFRQRQSVWLEDFTLFAALADRYGTADWPSWPRAIAAREPRALREARRDLREPIDYLTYFQFIFDRQWRELRRFGAKRGVRLLGDVPIFVGFESADVWAHQDQFLLDRARRPRYVSGAPPDSFNRNGQLWGHAIYDWARMEKDGFSWWLDRVRRALDLFDAVRLDHFIGFRRYWRVPGKARNARGGRWIPAPGERLFQRLQSALGQAPFIAEDLGRAGADVWELRDRFGIPGMRVLHFGFDPGSEDHYHAPHSLVRNCVVYTGTHDNDTTAGWYRSIRRKKTAAARTEARWIRDYLGSDGRAIHEDLIRCAFASVANLAIVPAQDLLGLGSRARMNTPGSTRNNWVWRLEPGALTDELAARLRRLTALYDRLGAG